MGKSISRRNFFKGSIVFAVGTLGAYQLAACAPVETSAEGSTAPASSGRQSSNESVMKKVTLFRNYSAAHGDKSFTQVIVAAGEDGKVLGASIDEYQFMDAATEGIIPVPNSDADFGGYYAEGYTLISKADNNEVYSAMMAEKAGATQEYMTSIDAITAYATGKTADELLDPSIDGVSGATLADTVNYLAAIAEAMEDSEIIAEGSYDENGSELKLGRLNSAVHGTKSFGNVVSVVQDDILVATTIDEFQFMAEDTDGIVGVPNSDGAFGEYYGEGQTLVSKIVNNDVYSALMAEKAGATTPFLSSIQAIQDAVSGQEISEISIEGPDTVSGATLADTAMYAAAAVEAAKLA